MEITYLHQQQYASCFGNHRVNNVLLLAAFASPRHAPSRTYYDRERRVIALDPHLRRANQK